MYVLYVDVFLSMFRSELTSLGTNISCSGKTSVLGIHKRATLESRGNTCCRDCCSGRHSSGWNVFIQISAWRSSIDPFCAPAAPLPPLLRSAFAQIQGTTLPNVLHSDPPSRHGNLLLDVFGFLDFSAAFSSPAVGSHAGLCCKHELCSWEGKTRLLSHTCLPTYSFFALRCGLCEAEAAGLSLRCCKTASKRKRSVEIL